MNQHVTLTPSQIALHQAAKERAWRKIEAAKQNTRRALPEQLPAPVRTYVEPIVYPIMQEPAWTVSKTRFDDHVTAWIRWRKEQDDIAASPMRAHIKKRALELLSTYDDTVSHSRRRIDVVPRHITMWEIKTFVKPNASLPEIGAIYGLDHTSVLHGVRRIQAIVDAGKLDEFVAEHMDRAMRGPRWKR